MKKYIINTEYYFECAGSCQGCFLTTEERSQKFTNQKSIHQGLESLSKQLTFKDELIVGFGRGNILTLNNNQLDEILLEIDWVEKNFKYKKITFELSTSLIGKLNDQINKGLYLLEKNKNIYFNIIVNSEIISKNFWNNVKLFLTTMEEKRREYNIIDSGDILVLNINPNKLPELEHIKNFLINHNSPINISLFPYDDEIIEDTNINTLLNWNLEVSNILKDKDFNVKNFLENIKNIDFDIYQIEEYEQNTEKSYSFIYKDGNITSGSISIMGEVDYLRLIKKYNIQPSMKKAYIEMQKRKSCQSCDNQKECLFSGAYINLLINKDKINNKICPNGYKDLFTNLKLQDYF